jgi:hypothetical protein
MGGEHDTVTGRAPGPVRAPSHGPSPSDSESIALTEAAGLGPGRARLGVTISQAGRDHIRLVIRGRPGSADSESDWQAAAPPHGPAAAAAAPAGPGRQGIRDQGVLS